MLISPISSFVAREIQPKAARMLRRKRRIILNRSGLFPQLSNLKKQGGQSLSGSLFITKKECDDYIIMQCHPFGVVQSDHCRWLHSSHRFVVLKSDFLPLATIISILYVFFFVANVYLSNL